MCVCVFQQGSVSFIIHTNFKDQEYQMERTFMDYGLVNGSIEPLLVWFP